MSNNINDAKFLVIDFETTTPKGYPPEPIELGLVRVDGTQIDSSAQKSWFIKPPVHAPLTSFDTSQTGITSKDLINAKSSGEIFDILEKICGKQDYVFVAQNAKYERSVCERFYERRPSLAGRRFIDTILLAKHILPNLPNFKLDTLAKTLGIQIPPDRHRALADCIITAQVLSRLLSQSELTDINQLFSIAEVKEQKEILPHKNEQLTLFDNPADKK